MTDLYDAACFECCKIITNKYSTSFSLGIRAFSPAVREPVYAVYGFVRLADEIVDTFHDHDKAQLISRFRAETLQAIDEGISLNPVLHAFQKVVNEYRIALHLIESFLASMEMDLDKKAYSAEAYQAYIYGSAEVVGLMCLKVFCGNRQDMYDKLWPQARKLGAAFQKINFLRDIRSDYEERGRVYFPGINWGSFTDEDKQAIEQDIQKDIDEGFEGIRELPSCAKRGVYIAYIYYSDLFRKIKSNPACVLLDCRVRISDKRKLWLMLRAVVRERWKKL